MGADIELTIYQGDELHNSELQASGELHSPAGDLEQSVVSLIVKAYSKRRLTPLLALI